MAQFMIILQTDNACFKEDIEGALDDVLAKIKARIISKDDLSYFRDINGNKCGYVELTEGDIEEQ